MKLIILLAVAALSSGAKLDKTYLPPSYAQTSGGNGQFLDAPGFQNNDFTQATSNRFANSNGVQNGDNFQNNDYAQNGNDFALNSNYPQNDGSFGQANGFIQNDGESFNDFNQRPERPQAALERSAAILRQDNSNDGETYAYAYETSNGIVAEENGDATDGVKAQGGYSYTGDDGKVYSVRYTADENGFVPQGDHLPTPPPIPEEILEALEKNAQDEANGIFDDGSYSDGKYNDDEQNNGAGYNYNNNNGINFNAGSDFNNDFNDVNADDDDSVVTNNALLRSNNAAQSTFGNQGVEKAYLPPYQQNAQRTQAGPNGRNSAQNNGVRYQSNNGFGSRIGVEKAYLPPQQFEQNARRTQNNGFRNQVNNGFNGKIGVERAYLPPQQFKQNPQAEANARYNPVQINGFRNQLNGGVNGQNGVEKSYLPPQKFGQRNQESNSVSNVQNGVNRAYLPPGQFGQRDQNVAARGRFIPQGNSGIRNQPSNIERTYLPPSSLSQGQSLRSQGFKSIGLTKKTSVSREYLPPSGLRRTGFESNALFNNNDENQF